MLALDPQDLPEAVNHYNAWVNAHNNHQTDAAVAHYDLLIEALDAAAQDKRLEPLRHSVIDALRNISDPSPYSPAPKVPSRDNTVEVKPGETT